MAIDPTARVSDGARLGDGVEIGPYCLVGADVVIEDGVRLIGHVHVTGATTIGVETVVYPFASLGTPPQSVHYKGGRTRLMIGAHCEIREGVTMNTGTEGGSGLTRVGERCMFMVGSHVGHDCEVGDAVIFANNAVLGGHAVIGNSTFLGGQAAVHQFVRVGEGAMISGLSGIANDLIPFGFAIGPKANLRGLNTVGLRRRGATRADLHRLRDVYRALFLGDGVFRERVEAVAGRFADDAVAMKIVDFVRAGGKRPLMRPSRHKVGDDDGHDAA
jgi:UDP-N-acetylglucosamine acyltransferase